MKIFTLLTGLFILFSISACEGDSVKLPCDELSANLIALNTEQVKPDINAILVDLPPVPTQVDPTGHQENLETFVEELRAGCSYIANVECYACIETNPPQTHVQILLDSAGTQVERILDILTPENSVMTMVNMHD